MNVGDLERAAGVADRKAFWEPYAHMPNPAGFVAGRDELRRRAGLPIPHDELSRAAGIPEPKKGRRK